MRRSLAVFTVLILVASVMVAVIVRAGLPMQSLQPPDGVAISALNAFATDTSRSDLFSGAVQRVVPFQMLYPASAPGTEAFYVPDAEPLIDAVARRQGWIAHVALTLQLRFVLGSESIGPHDSGDYGWSEHRLRRRLGFGRRRCGM